MKFEGFKTPKCSLLAPSNIDDPIFELASCNKTPTKCPPPSNSCNHTPTNPQQITFCFSSQNECDQPIKDSLLVSVINLPQAPWTPLPPIYPLKIAPPSPPFLFLSNYTLCLFFANVKVNSNNLVQILQALRVNVGKKICFFSKRMNVVDLSLRKVLKVWTEKEEKK